MVGLELSHGFLLATAGHHPRQMSQGMGSGEMGGGVLMALAGLIPAAGLLGVVGLIFWAVRRGGPGTPQDAAGAEAPAAKAIEGPASLSPDAGE